MKRSFHLVTILGVLVLGLSACAPVTLSPPALTTAAPAPGQAPAQPPGQATALPAAPTATTAPTATPVPPTATQALPSPTVTPAQALSTIPDPKQDPLGALAYASSGKSWRTATFTYTMNMKVGPADDASAKALGPMAQQLSLASVQGSGGGAMQVTDPQSGKANMQMQMDVAAAGQKLQIEVVTVDGQTWTRTGQKPWQKVNGTGTSAAQTPPNDAQNMLEALREAKDVQYVGRETFDGEAVHHLRFSLDPSRMDFSSTLGGMGSGVPGGMGANIQGLMQGSTIQVDAWLTAKDLLLRQEKISTLFKVPLPAPAQIQALLDMTMRFDKFNEPVQIKAPQGDAETRGAGDTGTGGCPAPAAGMQLLNNQGQGYCILVPSGYATQIDTGQTVLFVDSLQDVAHARANIEVQAAGGRTARAAANQALAAARASVPGINVQQSDLQLGGEPAVALSGMPGQDLNRQVFVVHNGVLFKLTFVPDDPAEADRYDQMQKLYGTVTGSWAFLP